jgi:hypothetical protein
MTGAEKSGRVTKSSGRTRAPGPALGSDASLLDPTKALKRSSSAFDAFCSAFAWLGIDDRKPGLTLQVYYAL